MIILKSHKTVLSGRAEGERRGHVPKVSATKSTQPDWQRRKANLLVLFYPHCFLKQTVELLKKSAGNYHPAKLFLCFSWWDNPREWNLWTKLDIHKNTNWLTPGSWWALAQGPMGTLCTSLGVSQGATVVINPWKVTPINSTVSSCKSPFYKLCPAVGHWRKFSRFGSQGSMTRHAFKWIDFIHITLGANI